MLFGWEALVVDKEEVHLQPQYTEIDDRLACRLVIEFANQFIVGRVEEWTRLVEGGEFDVLPLGAELLVDVGHLFTVRDRICVTEEHLRRSVLLHEVILVEPVHFQFPQFQYAEADVEWSVDERLYFPHLDSNQLLIEDFEAHTVWLFDKLLPLLLTCDEVDVGTLLLIFAGFPINRVVPHLEEVLFNVTLRFCAQRRVLLEIHCQAARLFDAQHR